MAVRKTNLSADRAANLKKSSVRAGKAKGSTAARQKQNAAVKDGTIRLGRSGKSYNVYDAKSGSWMKGVVKSASRPAAIANKMGSEGPRASKNVPVTMSPTGARPSGKPRKETTRVTRGSDGYVYYQRRVNNQWVTYNKQKASR